MRIASTNLPFPQPTRRFRLKIDFYACAIPLFVLDYSSRLRGALHRRVSSWRQLRGKGAAALVAEYSWTKLFWFNSAYFVVMIASVVLYDFRGGAWMILPLAWVIERACNGVWHAGWSIRFHEYSPGLVSSILMWMNLYFVVRYHPADQVVSSNIRIPVVVIGGAFTLFLMLYFPFVKGRQMPRP